MSAGNGGRKPVASPKLHSGMTGNGGRFAPNNGHADRTPNRASKRMRRETPYAVVGTTAGQWSTSVAHNTTRVYRVER